MEIKMTCTLPTGYANLIGYSDVQPFEILSVSKSGKQITIREMDVQRDPAWVPDFVAGGFTAHCANQEDQRWFIVPNESNPAIKAHKRADGYFWSAYGRHRVAREPRKFYDYNF
jgi:hypothetical protein